MKQKKTKKLLAMLLACVMAVMMMANFANAAGTSYETQRTDDSIEGTSFTKNLKIQNDSNIPACTFTFTASAAAKVDATDSTLAIIPGVTPEKIKFTPVGGTATEGTGDISYAAHNKTDTTGIAADNITLTTGAPDADHYIATKEMALDFSAVVFPEPGVYRYYITETGSNPGVVNDTNNVRTLDVYVEDALTEAKKLKITGYVLYVDALTTGPSNDINAATDTVDDTVKLEDGTTSKRTNGKEVNGAKKSVGFQNSYPSTGITFGKEVTGNQGSRDKYFEFKLEITNAAEGTVFDVNYTYADPSIAANPNPATTCITAAVDQPATLTAGTDKKAEGTFYLQDGQYITVYGLVEGMHYKVTEVKEDYTQTAGITKANSSFKKKSTDTEFSALPDDTEGDVAKVDIYTGYTNSKSGVIPTGVIVSAAGLLVVGVIAIIGFVFFGTRSKRRYEED